MIVAKRDLVSVVGLVLVELLCFLPIMRRVGFYLDDWATLCQLNFGPKEQGFWALALHYCLNNTLVVIRPIEAVHFCLAYWNFGIDPLPWHLVNVVFEIVTAILAYAILRRLSGSSAVGFFAAVFLLLCPTHDSSHYWVVCSSVSLSFALYLGSLLATLHAVVTVNLLRRLVLHSLSSVLFALSLFNYEMFMPLATVNVAISVLLSIRERSALLAESKKRFSLILFKHYFLSTLPTIFAMVLPILLLVLYLKLVVPFVSNSSMRSISFDISVFLLTVWNGVQLNSPGSFSCFVAARAAEGLEGLSSLEALRVLFITSTTTSLVVWLNSRDAISAPLKERSDSSISGMPLVFLGLVTIFVAYTIFGLSPDYNPTFLTLSNRINTGASFGLALVISGFFTSRAGVFGHSWERMQFSLMVIFCVLSVSVFSLANIGLSKPWIASWKTQKHIQEKLVKHAGLLPAGASVLLLNCPRYVMWAPVYDGVWDFQNTARILLNQKNFNANVVSERLIVDAVGVKDVSRGIECGVYAFSSLYLLVPPDCLPLRASTPQQFIDIVEEKGMGFGLQREAVTRWKVQAGAAGR